MHGLRCAAPFHHLELSRSTLAQRHGPGAAWGGETALAAARKLASLDGAAFAVVKSSQSGPAIAAVLAELEG